MAKFYFEVLKKYGLVRISEILIFYHLCKLSFLLLLQKSNFINKIIMKILILTLIIVFTTINFGFSQNNRPFVNNENDVYLKIPVEEEINNKARVYYSTNWESGNIVKKDSSIMTNLSFRYDVKNDRFEMWSFVNPESINIITLKGKFFIYTDFMYKKTYKRKGYFQIVIDGYAKLLLRRNIKRVPGKAGAYGYKSRQAVIETYYLKIGNKPAVKFDINKKNIAKLFPKQTDKVKNFVIKKHINLKRDYDMIKLVNYYNSLFEKS